MASYGKQVEVLKLSLKVLIQGGLQVGVNNSDLRAETYYVLVRSQSL